MYIESAMSTRNLLIYNIKQHAIHFSLHTVWTTEFDLKGKTPSGGFPPKMGRPPGVPPQKGGNPPPTISLENPDNRWKPPKKVDIPGGFH